MRRSLALLAFSTALLAGAQAHATVTLSPPPGVPGGLTLIDNFSTDTVGNAPTSNSFVSYSGGAFVENTSVQNQYLSPVGLGAPGNFLVVPGTPAVTETFTLLQGGASSLGFDWGSIDFYNSITLNTSTGSYTFTGCQLGASACNGTVDEYVTFSGLGTITSFTESNTNTSNAFETANYAEVSAVPEASTWAMLLVGFLGVGFMSYRGRGKSSAMRFA